MRLKLVESFFLRKHVCTSILRTFSGVYFVFIAFSLFQELFSEQTADEIKPVILKPREHRAPALRDTTSRMLHHIPETKRAELLSSFWQLDVMPNASRQARKHFYCDSYQRTAHRNRTSTTVYNIFAYDVVEALGDVTLVSHLTVTRFFMLDKLLSRWSGPLSVAMLVLESEKDLFWHVMMSRTYHPNLQMHVVIDKEGYYPVNYLRNVVLKNAKTDFVLLVDVDFMPAESLTNDLRKLITNGTFNKTELKAYVVPAFELLKSTPFPETKLEVIKLWRKGKIRPFHRTLPYFHRPTNYAHWRIATRIYQVTYKRLYEPYIVVPRCLCPLYYENLVGRGYNKIAHIMELNKIGFRFHVLPDSYLMHLPHKKVVSTAENFKCSLRSFRYFIKYLKKKMFSYYAKGRLPNC